MRAGFAHHDVCQHCNGKSNQLTLQRRVRGDDVDAHPRRVAILDEGDGAEEEGDVRFRALAQPFRARARPPPFPLTTPRAAPPQLRATLLGMSAAALQM